MQVVKKVRTVGDRTRAFCIFTGAEAGGPGAGTGVRAWAGASRLASGVAGVELSTTLSWENIGNY